MSFCRTGHLSPVIFSRAARVDTSKVARLPLIKAVLPVGCADRDPHRCSEAGTSTVHSTHM